MDITLNILMQMIGAILAVAGALVFAVMLIVEVIKNLGPLKNIPTNIFVFVLAIIGALIVYPLYFESQGIIMLWYAWVGVAFLGFLIAYVAMFGWDKLKELWDRSKYKEDNTQNK